MKTNPGAKLAKTIRRRTNEFIRLEGFNKKYKFQEYIGCTVQELIIYIESKFQPGMTWDNHTNFGWHIDHIIPLTAAKGDVNKMYRLAHYTNLQPMWWRENLSKNGKF